MAESQAESEFREAGNDFLKRRETGEGFFERWQSEFQASRHPLSRALHRVVQLDDLKERSEAEDYLYSRSTFKLIDDAKVLSKAQTVEAPHKPVVRLEDVAATLLLRVHEQPHTGEDHAIDQRLTSALSSLPATEALKVVSRSWWKFGGAAPRAWWDGSGGEVKVGG